jgi:hypothetical protein
LNAEATVCASTLTSRGDWKWLSPVESPTY